MKKQNTQSKVIVALTAVVLLLVALSATLTFAYFTATNNASSDAMQFGTLTLTAPTASATQVSDTCGTPAHTLVPGCSITVSGGATVGGNVNALMRLRVTAEVYQVSTTSDTYFKLVDNKVVGATSGEQGAFQATKTISSVVDSPAAKILGLVNDADVNGWTFSGDSFYCNKVVSGDVTPTAFSATFTTPADELGNDWQGARVQFGITVEAIQADHLVDGANEVVIAKDASNVITSVTVGNDSAITAANAADMFAAIAAIDAWTFDLETGLTAQQS